MNFYQPKTLPNLMVAPNGARRTKSDHPAIPVTLEETVETTKRCHAAGAEAIHFHLRDDAQQHILEYVAGHHLADENVWLLPQLHDIF